MAEHYFTATPSTPAEEHTVRYTARGINYAATAADGVFSARGLDKGTEVLLSKVPTTQLSAGTLAVDVGCGWGPITMALGHEYSLTHILGVDVNERALALTQRNCLKYELAHVHTEEATAALTRLRTEKRTIDLIWSNPPIRIGKQELHDLLLNWLELLTPNSGKAYWVVQKNLGADSLTAWLNSQGYPSEKIASSKGFRIIQSVKPATA